MTYTYGTLATNGTTFVLGPNEGERPPKPPKGLIATQAVQTKAGWFGQVFVDKTIVFESAEPHEGADAAIGEANERVVTAVAGLFADPLSDSPA